MSGDKAEQASPDALNGGTWALAWTPWDVTSSWRGPPRGLNAVGDRHHQGSEDQCLLLGVRKYQVRPLITQLPHTQLLPLPRGTRPTEPPHLPSGPGDH